MFQAVETGGLHTGSLVTVGACATIGAIFGCSVGSLIGAGTLGYGCGCGALSGVRRAHRCSMASRLFGGGLLVPWITYVSWYVAYILLSVVVIVGTLIAWCVNVHVSVRRTPPVSVKAFMTL